MRAFVAMDVSSDALVKLQNEIISASRWTPKDVKIVEPRNFHFTLIFLGDIGDTDTDRIKEKLAGFSFEPFSITYTGIGGFPTTAHARVIWVGVDSQGAQKLTAIANGVIEKLSELGFNADKPFSAHMTIFRSKGRPMNAGYISSKYQGMTFGSEWIDKVHLKKSELRTSGPIYSNVYTVEAKK
jgi:2'-5' RNA ligase